ncbi:MAG: nuclear transport factor 2 family protein [Acidobacteriota bacterium]
MRRIAGRIAGIAFGAFATASLARGEPVSAVPERPPPAAASTSLEETLTRLEKQSWEAWKGRDGKFFQDFLSDDHVEVGFGGPTDKATVVSGVASPVCVVRGYSIDRFHLTALDANTALLTYHAAQDTTCGGQPVPSPVWASSLYVRRAGRWWNALYQQTPTAQK